MKTLVWQHLPCDDQQSSTLAAELGVHPTVARLLCMRGFGNPDAARRFLNPALDDLHDPFRMADMDRAIARLEHLILTYPRSALVPQARRELEVARGGIPHTS